MCRSVAIAAVLVVSIAVSAVTSACGAEPSRDKAVSRGVSYLLTQGQAADGSYSKQTGIGVTALVTTSLLRSGRTPKDPAIAKSLALLESNVQKDGGVYQPGSRLVNYETCLAIVCFQEANRDRKYDKIIKNAEKFVKGLQIDEADGKDSTDFSYGGATYGGQGRPDLSNTSFLIEALQSAGASKDDEAVKKALMFVSRCQNLETEHNTTPFAAKNPDGGFYYTCVAGGASAADKLPDGGLRSYGSMTYAGLKSMIFAGVGPDDPRVKAATTWIKRHYDLKNNPGLGDAGLYYYYHLFAKALDALEVDTITDAEGVEHDWRKELIAELGARQRDDGSWLNDNERWLERDPNLVTGYALLALAYCK
jgi:squalene-hopene/tetraprenyl-beta-curcumene cyclase